MNKYSLSVDNIDNGAKLTEVRSVVNVGDASNLNKTSENLENGKTACSKNVTHSPSILFLLAQMSSSTRFPNIPYYMTANPQTNSTQKRMR